MIVEDFTGVAPELHGSAFIGGEFEGDEGLAEGHDSTR